jgi:hypothetical protein
VGDHFHLDPTPERVNPMADRLVVRWAAVGERSG